MSKLQTINPEIKWLSLAAIVTVVLWNIPGGNYILYPFTILATWFHEVSHGIAASLLGGSFSSLQIFPDGSGFARFSHPTAWGAINKAVVAAAGPLGPPIAGFLFLIASRTKKAISFCLLFLSLALFASTLLWVRSPFGLLFVPLLGVLTLAVYIKGSEATKAFSVRFLGVQACLSTYRQVGYLFSYSAGSLGLSDTAQMQQALFLPYWFWGALLAVASLLLLVYGLRLSYSGSR